MSYDTRIDVLGINARENLGKRRGQSSFHDDGIRQPCPSSASLARRLIRFAVLPCYRTAAPLAGAEIVSKFRSSVVRGDANDRQNDGGHQYLRVSA
jgi:hypothetical protein